MKVRCFYCEGTLRHSYVYVMHQRGDGCVKVGYAARPSKRASELRQQFRSPISVFAKFETCCEFSAMAVEDKAHRKLKPYWSGRGEWFNCTAEHAAEVLLKILRRTA